MTTTETGRAALLPRVTFTVLVLGALAVAGMYVRGGRTSVGVILAGGLPVILAVALLAAAVGWRHLRWLRLAIVVGLLASQAPLLDHTVGDGRPTSGDGQRIRVATLNTNRAGASDDEIVSLRATAIAVWWVSINTNTVIVAARASRVRPLAPRVMENPYFLK